MDPIHGRRVAGLSSSPGLPLRRSPCRSDRQADARREGAFAFEARLAHVPFIAGAVLCSTCRRGHGRFTGRFVGWRRSRRRVAVRSSALPAGGLELIGNLLQEAEGHMSTEAGAQRARALRAQWSMAVGQQLKSSKPPTYSGRGSDAERLALAAHSKLYDALNARDADAMSSAWAGDCFASEAAVVHPGRSRGLGREGVLESFAELQRQGKLPELSAVNEKVLLSGQSAVVVTCTEETSSGGYFEVTNALVQEGNDWRYVLHHASPVLPGSERFMAAVFGKGFQNLWREQKPADIMPVGINVVDSGGSAGSRVPPKNQASETDLAVETKLLQSVGSSLAGLLAEASDEAERLRSQALQARWEAVVSEFERCADSELEQDASQGVRDSALAANGSFYRAFNARDVEAMARLWSVSDENESSNTLPCECVHPGHARIAGRVKVLSSWEVVFNDPALPSLEVISERVLLAVQEGAVVVCTTKTSTGDVTEITNTFARDKTGSLLMVGHHGSPVLARAKAS